MNIRLALMAGLLTMAAACGGYSPSSPTPTPAPAPNPGTTGSGTPVSIVRGADRLTTTAYAPNPIEVAVGGTVTWTNNDTTAHTSTGNDGSWNSGSVAPGASFTRTYSNAGTFAYHCTIHPNMVGTVTVR